MTTTEDRLRDALDRHSATVVAPQPAWDEIEREADAVVNERRRRRFAGLSALATAAAVAVVLLAVSRDGDDGTEYLGNLPALDRTTTSVPVETTVAPSPVAAVPVPADGIYPNSSDGKYRDPAVTTRAFATEYLGMSAPVLGSFEATGANTGTMRVRANRRVRIGTTLTLERSGADGPWTVTAAKAENIAVTTPARLAAIGSPVRVTGRAQAFEGTVNVEVREDGMRSGSSLGTSFVTGASDTMAPFEGTVAFRRPSKTAGAVLFIEHSAEDGSPLVATVVRVRFGGRGAPAAVTTTTTARAPAPKPMTQSALRFDGIGGVKLGMTKSEARAAAGEPVQDAAFGECQSLRAGGITLVMSGGDRVNVITVNSGSTETDRGIGIGSTQAAVLDAYSGAEVRNPEEQRHWVFARSGDGEHTIVFEIEDGAVVAFRTGLRQVVEADEICA